MAQTFEWIDPAGVHTTLTATTDLNGRFMPAVSFMTDKLPGRDGEMFRRARMEARSIVIPIYVSVECTGTSASIAARHEAIRDLVWAMLPTRGTGTLRMTMPDGSQRDLNCHYTGGLELPEKWGSTQNANLQKATLTFIAHDPWWRDSGPTVLDFVASDAVDFFPFFPMHLSTSQIVTKLFVSNPGTIPSWPIWKIYGPGSVIKLINADTGQRLDFTNNGGLTLPAGEIINIDTSEGIKSVTRESDGANLFPYLTNDSELWPIPPGGFNLELQMAGTTSGASTAKLIFTPQYASA